MGREEGLTLLTLATVATGFMAFLDDPIDERFIEGDDFYIKPAIGLARIGDSYDRVSSRMILAGLSASMLTGSLILQDQKLLETTRLTVESALIAGAITQAAKRIFGRARPYTGEGPAEFEPLTLRSGKEIRSFPSGHATSAFAMMTVIAKQYNKWWVKIPAYTVAVAVALQRIDSRNHWSADVVVGGAIGYWVGSSLVNRYKQQSNKRLVNPYILGGRVGVLVNF